MKVSTVLNMMNYLKHIELQLKVKTTMCIQVVLTATAILQIVLSLFTKLKREPLPTGFCFVHLLGLPSPPAPIIF